jgi:hypothetical protein
MGRNIVQNRTIAAFCKKYAALGEAPALPGKASIHEESEQIHPALPGFLD